jgi:hypothetical protein
MNKLLADLLSWYWWISVVLIGLLINLTSAYAKPHLDAWIAARSERAQAKRTAATASFDRQVSRLASDPTLLIVAGQRLQNLQHTTFSIGALLGFLLALSIFFGAAPPKTLIERALQIIAGVGAAILMTIHFSYLRMESELEDKVRAARRRYESVDR